MNIVFMGTPDFAVGVLEEILKSEHKVLAVITAPDKPSGRGQQLNESAVKKFASDQNLTILQPSNLKDEAFNTSLKELNADVFVVVAFRMLPEQVWSMPKKGTINLHASLLPNYRGAAPINWAIINGEKETGVTTFFIEKEIDTGLVIEQERCSIEENETAGELHDKLLEIGKKLVVQSLNKIEQNKVNALDQNKIASIENAPSAPKIFKEMCKIDITKKAANVHDFCRGLSPYPTAWLSVKNKSNYEQKSIKIFKTELTNLTSQNKNELLLKENSVFLPTQDYYLKIVELQMEGKKRTSAEEFFRGYSKVVFEIC